MATEIKEKIVLPIKGMTCASCVSHVAGALQEVEGAEDVNVNLATEKATVSLEHGGPRLGELIHAVEARIRPDPSNTGLRVVVDLRGAVDWVDRRTVKIVVGNQIIPLPRVQIWIKTILQAVHLDLFTDDLQLNSNRRGQLESR